MKLIDEVAIIQHIKKELRDLCATCGNRELARKLKVCADYINGEILGDPPPLKFWTTGSETGEGSVVVADKATAAKIAVPFKHNALILDMNRAIHNIDKAVSAYHTAGITESSPQILAAIADIRTILAQYENFASYLEEESRSGDATGATEHISASNYQTKELIDSVKY